MSMACVCCSHRPEHHPALDAADSLIESRPDSALAILSAINPAQLHSRPLAARYAVLMSMALDKNYIDTADFTVIQPAIDYYLTHGTPDERLRTLYYTGIIHKNRGERNEAMSCFMDAAELRDQVTDSLVLARNFVMQGVYYFDQYRIGSATDKYLQAARLYESKRPDLALDSYIRALYGAIIKENKSRADSIMSICESMIPSFPESDTPFDTQRLSYQIHFGMDSDVYDVLSNTQLSKCNDFLKYALVRTYIRLKDGSKALYYLDMINTDSTEIGLDRYYITKAEALCLTNDFKGATDAYIKYIDLSSQEMADLINSELPYSGKRHEIQQQHIQEIQKRNRVVLISVLIASILALVCLFVSYNIYRIRTKRIIAEQANRNLQLELESRIREREAAETEKHASELEIENLRLRNDANELALCNLRLEKSRLENESENLRILLKEKTDLDESIRLVIRERLSLLNSMIAQEITKNDALGRPYNNFIKQLQKDKLHFMESTRVAFTASHPDFIHHLEDHNLTADEIYVCCLYAIGLRGKEVGEYTQFKSHYNMSSNIRKKLGMTEHDTNLNKHIQQLLDK